MNAQHSLTTKAIFCHASIITLKIAHFILLNMPDYKIIFFKKSMQFPHPPEHRLSRSATYALQWKQPMKNKTEKNKPGRVLSLYPWTTSTRTFVNLQLNKSKLSFCKSEILTNVNAAFVATRHGELTNVSTNARFVFVNVTTSHGLTTFFFSLV